MPAQLTLESGIASPRIHDLDETAIVKLGRHRDNTIVLKDRHASRWHAHLFCVSGQWFIRDEPTTTNGTRIDGAPIVENVPLRNGQILTIAEVQLRFHSGDPDEEDTCTPDEPQVVPVPADTTLFEADDLTALFHFTNQSNAEMTPGQLVARALEVVLRHTGAQLVGFLSLDDAVGLRLVLPAQAEVDHQLSRRLTQLVHQKQKMVWLCAPDAGTVASDSLSAFRDAVCVPLRGLGSEAPLGALHAYQTRQPFTQRQVRFCEVLAGNLASALHLLRARRALEADNSRLRAHAPEAGDELIGDSQPMTLLRQQIRRLAPSPCTVLICGESGVGKELVALGLHHQSDRHRGPLLPVNCAAITAGMAESELFGHVRGAFTGATSNHTGFFAQADMGTLFFDELGELSLDLQAKLLRAIETRRFRPVGAKADVCVDVRIIAATNRDLERAVAAGKFRRDLYYRLTSRIDVPPLREHREDIPELAQHFLDHFQSSYHRTVTLSEAALMRLANYSWPGNVRQLRSVIEGALALAENGATISAGALHLPPEEEFGLESPGTPPASLNLEEIEQWAIRRALMTTKDNQTQAARLLGIHRTTLIEKVKRYGIGKGE